MPAYASSDMLLLDQWKDAADKNPMLGFVDSVLSGYGQIAFSDNPLTGLCFLIGCFVGDFTMGVASIVSVVIATLFAQLLRVPAIALRLGLYGFNAVLAGLGVVLFIYPGQGVTAGLLITCGMVAVLCVLLTAALSAFLAPYGSPSLALPYCMTLFILVPASLFFLNLSPGTSAPALAVMSQGEAFTWTAGDFVTAFFANMAEILWQAKPVCGVIYLVGVLFSSRIDGISAVLASAAATIVAIAMGLPASGILIGLYGYNAILLMQVLFGRGFKMSAASFITCFVLSMITIIIQLWLAAVFRPLGAPVAAFPYSLVAILALIGRGPFAKLRYVEPLKWGVPETIAKELKKEETAV